jgi:Protein of unknown function (DUF4231)
MTSLSLKAIAHPQNYALVHANKVSSSIAGKATFNKYLARASFIGMIVITVLIPLLIGSSDSRVWSKLVPSILAAISAFLASWIQLERPMERWILYRRYHRIIDAEISRYKFQILDYKNPTTADKILIEKITDLELELHRCWEGILPRGKESLPT